MLHLFINNPDTLLLENLCAITLYKKYGESLFYFNKSIEVDFYVPDEGLAIQASYRMSDKTTLERNESPESSPFLQASYQSYHHNI